MKVARLFLTAMIAVGLMASCNSNNDEAPTIEGAKATITVTVVASGKAGSRLAGDLTAPGNTALGLPAESKIWALEVFVFHNNGVLEGYRREVFASGNPLNTVEEVTVTSGPRILVVTANTNIGRVANLATLKAKVSEDLSQTDINTIGLVMTGPEVNVDLEPGANLFGVADDARNTDLSAKIYATNSGTNYELTRINARIALTSMTVEFTPENSTLADSFELHEVAMFNARSKSNLFGAFLVAGAGNDHWYGSQYPSSAGSYIGAPPATPAAHPSLLNTFEEPPNFLAITNSQYFYAFENTEEDGTFIVLKGKLTKDGQPIEPPYEGLYTDAAGFTYYAIGIGQTDKSLTHGAVVRNTQYNISVTIKGPGNPTIDPTEDSFLDVIIEVKDWSVVNQSVIW